MQKFLTKLFYQARQSSGEVKRKTIFLLLIFIFLSFIMSGQKKTDEIQGLVFELKALTLLNIPDPTGTPYDTDYEKDNDTYIMGLGFETNYYFDKALGIDWELVMK